MKTHSNKEVIANVTGDVYRAAFECRAKNDPRYYLEGLLLDRGNLVGTNGHILYVGPADMQDGFEEDIIFEAPKIPASIVEVVILPAENKKWITLRLLKKNGDERMLMVKVIEGRYPDYKSIKEMKTKKKPMTRFGFNAGYLQTLATIFGKEANLEFYMPNNGSPAHITSFEGGKQRPGVAILMPVRLP